MAIVLAFLGYLAVDAVAVEVCAREARHDARRVGFLDVKERVGWHQVDAAHVDALARNVVVEHVDEVSGKEAVGLAGVHIDARHAFLGGAAVFFRVGAGGTLAFALAA